MVYRLLVCLLFCAILWQPPAHAHAHALTIRPGAVLVGLQPAANRAALRTQLPADVRVETTLAPRSLTLRVPVGAEHRYARRLAALPGVAYAQVDHMVAAQVQPNDPRYAEQWNMAQIGMPSAWAVITDTTALTIATLDTGIDLEHPDLQEQLWTNSGEIANNNIDDDGNGFVDDVHGMHFYQLYSGGQALPRENADLNDANGHGTHVAGIIAATGDNGVGVAGVTWRARLMSVRVLDDDAVGWESDVVRGLSYAVANGARVVNMSLGLAQPGPALGEAVAQAEAQGVLLVAAAGNSSGNALYPAAYASVLT